MPTITNPVRSPLALACGAFLAYVTARVIVGEAASWASLSTGQLVSLSALVAAIVAGILYGRAFSDGAWTAGTILLVVSLAATGYVVVNGAMGNAARSAGQVDAARSAREARDDARATLRRLSDDLDRVKGAPTTQAVRAAMDAVVGDGPGKVPFRVFSGTTQCTDITLPASQKACQPLLDLRVQMADAIRKATLEPQVAAARAKLDAHRAVSDPSVGYATAGRAIAWISCAAGCADVEARAKAIEAALPDVLAALAVLIAELGTIGCLRYAFHAPQRPAGNGGNFPLTREAVPAPVQARAEAVEAPAVVAHSAITDTVRADAGKKPSGGQHTKDEALADLLTMLALGQSVPSQRTLAERWGRPKQTVSDWLREWEGDGLIPARRQVGREKMLAGASAPAQREAVGA